MGSGSGTVVGSHGDGSGRVDSVPDFVVLIGKIDDDCNFSRVRHFNKAPNTFNGHTVLGKHQQLSGGQGQVSDLIVQRCL